MSLCTLGDAVRIAVIRARSPFSRSARVTDYARLCAASSLCHLELEAFGRSEPPIQPLVVKGTDTRISLGAEVSRLG